MSSKRKREENLLEDNDTSKNENECKYIKISKSPIKNLEYYCYYHSNDPQICKIYECCGYRDKDNEEKKDYLN